MFPSSQPKTEPRGRGPAFSAPVWALFLTAIAMLCPQSASAQTMPLAVQPCPGSDTIVVQLANGPAFRLPPDRIKFGPLMPPSTDAAAPQYGCPGNPVVTSVIATAVAVPESLLTGTPSERSFVQSLWINSDKTEPIHQNSNLALFQLIRERHPDCETTQEGFEYCYDCTVVDGLCTDRDAGAAKRSTFYGALSLPGVYDGADGKPFSMFCDGTVIPSAKAVPDFENCRVGYAMTDGLNVAYSIEDPQIPRDHIIAFDKEIRRQILSYRAPEYDGAVVWTGP